MMKTKLSLLCIAILSLSAVANAQDAPSEKKHFSSFKEAAEKTVESIKLSAYSGLGEIVAIGSGFASATYHGTASAMKAVSKNPHTLKAAASYRDWGHAFAAIAVAGGVAWYDGSRRLDELNGEGPAVADRNLKERVTRPVAEPADAAVAGAGNRLQ